MVSGPRSKVNKYNAGWGVGVGDLRKSPKTTHKRNQIMIGC